MSRRQLELQLLNLNIPGAGTDADDGTTAVDDATYVMTVEAALHSDRLRDVDTAGAGIGVEVEVGVANDETDGAAACTQLPVCGGLALSFNVAAACTGFEGSGEAVKANATAAGLCFDIAGSGLFEFNVTGA